MAAARVVAAHRAPEREPIRVSRGQVVQLGDRDTEWPQFVWTTVEAGKGGWVPAELFDRTHGRATALAGYDTRELSANAGQIVRLHHELASWWWVEDEVGNQGWIPARVLEFLENEIL